jgi:hypothetical protein
VRFLSRNGNTFRNFNDLAQWIAENLRVGNAVIDSVACVDDRGVQYSMTCCSGGGNACSSPSICCT